MITTIKEDPDTGELYIELSSDMLKELDWNTGDMLEWNHNEKLDAYSLTKVKNDNTRND